MQRFEQPECEPRADDLPLRGLCCGVLLGLGLWACAIYGVFF